MTTRTSNRSGFAVLAEATTMDISLIGTKRDGESLQLERTSKRLRNDDQERCDAIDTIGSNIISHNSHRHGSRAEITQVTTMLSDAFQQYTEPANTQALTRKEELNWKRVLREFLVAHLLSSPHRYQLSASAGGDERKLRDMMSIYDHPTLFSVFSKDVHTVTVGEAIEAVNAWIRYHKDGVRTLKNVLQLELNVPSLWYVLDTDRGKDLHRHVESINERRHNSIEIQNIARDFNESCKQQWIQAAEQAKLLVTYHKYEATTVNSNPNSRITELETANTALASELATIKETVTILPKTVTDLTQKVTKLLALNRSAV
ncbi:hypothetical protein FN846DRAFT_887379 [Sphaerosporella brunnea]|uniref:Uncharacterized protein n=1 Tax=Sphaerosporella brunnea TaxID=1250544 RepID=A0A5J5F6H0_9PEZI|nr:hypothetical protein FN846DRAFT_887379 [Sphaerosporella brunnea]